MKVDHSLFFVSPKFSASSFAMPSRPTKRSRSRDGQLDRPLKRVSLGPVNSADVFPPRPVFHAVLPVVDFPHQKLPITPVDGYSMAPLWEPRPPQNDTTPQSPPSHGNQTDDGDVRMDCDSTPRPSTSPIVPPSPPTSPPCSSSLPSNTEGVSSLTPQPLTSYPSAEMNEVLSPVSQGPPSQVIRPGRPKRPRFTMGPQNDCDKCRAGVKGHWGHFT